MKNAIDYNSHVCWECNGEGCKMCVGGLSGTGYLRFPVSVTIDGYRPSVIENPYPYRGVNLSGNFKTTKHALRTR